VQKEFSDLLEKIDNADKLNKELEDPYNMEPDTSMADEINEQMEEAKKNLGKGKKIKHLKISKKLGMT